MVGDIKCVMNEGMPRYRSPFEKGRLIITFEVCVQQNNYDAYNDMKLTIHKQIRLLAPNIGS